MADMPKCCGSIDRKREVPLYGVHPYIAEFFMTVSNLSFGIVGCIRLLLHLGGSVFAQQWDGHIWHIICHDEVRYLYMLLIAAALCSGFHHACDMRWTILVDWVPIFISLCMVFSFGTSTITISTMLVVVIAFAWLVFDHLKPLVRSPVGHSVWHILAALAADAVYQDLDRYRVQIDFDPMPRMPPRAGYWSLCLVLVSLAIVKFTLTSESTNQSKRRQEFVSGFTKHLKEHNQSESVDVVSEIIPGRLYISGMFAVLDQDVLKTHGIKHVISLVAINQKLPEGIESLQWPVSEDGVGKYTQKQLVTYIKPFAALMKRSEGAVLVHDSAGTSNSVTLVLSFLLMLREHDHRTKFGKMALYKLATSEDVSDRNVGDKNVGDKNVGDKNVGDKNVGDKTLRGLLTHIRNLRRCLNPVPDNMMLLEELQYQLDHGELVDM